MEREKRRRASRAREQRLVFRGAALRLQSLRDPELMLSGPSETGKTWATLWYLDTFLRAYPGAQGAMVRKVRVTIAPTVLRTYTRIQAMRAEPATPYGGNNPVWYDYPNGSRLWIGGMDDPGKVLSGERDIIYGNQAEELSENDWEILTTRATGRGSVAPYTTVLGDCNPGPADHWIVRRRQAGALTFLESRHRDNPSLYHEDGSLTEQGARTMAVLDRLTGVRRLRLRDGLWVGAEGQFFEAWDEDIHVVDPFPIPADWPVWGALDHGFAHNTAFGLYTRHDGVVYKIGEHVQHKWLPPQHAAAIQALCARLQVRPRRIVAGLDVFQSRGDSSGRTLAQQYADLGLPLTEASVDRISGAGELLTRLGNPEAGLAPTLKVFRTCPRTILGIPAMVHDPARPEDVLKVDADADGRGGDDCYDETRYGLMAERLSVPSTIAVNPLYSGDSEPVYVPGRGLVYE